MVSERCQSEMKGPNSMPNAPFPAAGYTRREPRNRASRQTLDPQQPTATHRAMERTAATRGREAALWSCFVILSVFSGCIAAASPGSSGCPCKTESLCKTVAASTRKEVFGFSVSSDLFPQ